MERAGRLSAAQKQEPWERWQRGETLVEIGRALHRSTVSVDGSTVDGLRFRVTQTLFRR